MNKLIILGASGSIGTQSLEILKEYKSLNYELIGFSVGNKVDKIEKIIEEFPRVKYVYAIDESKCQSLKLKFPNISFFFGEFGMEEMLKKAKPDSVLNALVGFAGVIPSLTALEISADLYLANKESLVVAGDLINNILAKHKSKLFPIDSEHVAIEKCLAGHDKSDVKKIILTCSGGPFILKKWEELEHVTLEEALNHPTWKMGNKITIDSATLINKVFEIVEAHYLFGVKSNDIEVLIHKESLIHSLIQLIDGSYLCDIGIADMKNPILYALANNKRLNFDHELDIFSLTNLTFIPLSKDRAAILNLGKLIIDQGGNTGAIVNAANDVAVAAFLDNKIKFSSIYTLIFNALNSSKFIEKPTINDIVITNYNVKNLVTKMIEKGDC
ncbi:MAG: 1-deoxy-D-xylulose-5-phosphate reductoisomerase [Bacilli bacterium]